MDSPAFIYLLTDPMGIRYVGVSVNPPLRLKHHHYEANNPNGKTYNHPKSRWLRKVGSVCRLRVLWAGTEAECYRREPLVIAECRDRGHPILNLAEGGHRPPRINMLPDADAIRKKISESARRRVMSPETRRRMSVAHKGKAEHLRAYRDQATNPRNKPVVKCLPDGTDVETYRSGRAAARAVGVSPGALSEALTGKTNLCAGHKWRFA